MELALDEVLVLAMQRGAGETGEEIEVLWACVAALAGEVGRARETAQARTRVASLGPARRTDLDALRLTATRAWGEAGEGSPVRALASGVVELLGEVGRLRAEVAGRQTLDELLAASAS